MRLKTELKLDDKVYRGLSWPLDAVNMFYAVNSSKLHEQFKIVPKAKVRISKATIPKREINIEKPFRVIHNDFNSCLLRDEMSSVKPKKRRVDVPKPIKAEFNLLLHVNGLTKRKPGPKPCPKPLSSCPPPPPPLTKNVLDMSDSEISSAFNTISQSTVVPVFLIKATGPDHMPTFTISWNDFTFKAATKAEVIFKARKQFVMNYYSKEEINVIVEPPNLDLLSLTDYIDNGIFIDLEFISHTQQILSVAAISRAGHLIVPL